MINVKAEKAITTSISNTESGNYKPIILDPATNTCQIVNTGNMAAPCRVTYIPKNDVILFVLEGLSKEPIKIEKIYAGQVLVIDAIDKVVTIDGEDAFFKYDAWELPTLQPGNNIITCTAIGTSIVSIEYQPRYI